MKTQLLHRFSAILSLLFITISLTACSGDPLKGTWVDEGNSLGSVTWTFDGNGNCTMSNDYFSNEQGIYETSEDGKTLTILLDLWGSTESDAEKYTYSIEDDTLTMTSQGQAADYTLKRQ